MKKYISHGSLSGGGPAAVSVAHGGVFFHTLCKISEIGRGPRGCFAMIQKGAFN